MNLDEDSKELLQMSNFPTGFQGKYEERGLIGSGGMSHVYEVINVGLDARRALKIMRLDLTQSRRQINRFRQEAQILASCNFDGIVKVYDVGEDDNGLPFIEMEYLEGRSLKNIIEEDECIYM